MVKAASTRLREYELVRSVYVAPKKTTRPNKKSVVGYCFVKGGENREWQATGTKVPAWIGREFMLRFEPTEIYFFGDSKMLLQAIPPGLAQSVVRLADGPYDHHPSLEESLADKWDIEAHFALLMAFTHWRLRLVYEIRVVDFSAGWLKEKPYVRS